MIFLLADESDYRDVLCISLPIAIFQISDNSTKYLLEFAVGSQNTCGEPQMNFFSSFAVVI